MRKKVFAVITLAAMLLGVFVFAAAPKQAYAIGSSMDCALPIISGGDTSVGTHVYYTIDPGSLGVTSADTNSNEATVHIKWKLSSGDLSILHNCTGDPATKVNDTDSNGTFGPSDGKGNAWTTFLDNALEQSTSNGMFLEIAPDDGTNGTLDSSLPGKKIEVFKNAIQYQFDPPSQITSCSFTDTTDSHDSNFMRNIGCYLWKANPAAWFQSNTQRDDVQMTVKGLAPGTNYRARLVVKGSSSLSTGFFGTITMIASTGPGILAFVQGPREAFSQSFAFATKPAGDTTQLNTGASSLTQDQQQALTDQNDNGFTANLHCDSTGWTIAGCANTLFYNIFVSVSAWVAKITGYLFDAFAAVSLGSNIYGGGTQGAGIYAFIQSGWGTVRDISNIFFIFILLYTALGLVLSLAHFDAKKLISKVIIIALLINFSLFFCRVTVDASNILSRVFYSAMNISTVGNPSATNQTDVKEQSISAAIMQGIQPQSILSQNSFDKLKGVQGGISDGTMFFVLLLAVILNLALAYIFFMCAAFFAGRIGVIWFSMIFAPLAFVSSIIPGLDHNLKQLGWSNWLSSFMKACFNAPIFFFFMYLVVQLTSPGAGGGGLLSTLFAATSSPNTATGWVTMMVGIMLPAMIIIGLLMAAKKIAQEMAGEFGAAFAGVVAAGVGLAAMAATGGAAVVGRSTLGAVANKISSPDNKFGNKMRDIASGTGFGASMARIGVRTTEAGKKASFDVRNTGVANSLSKATGVDMNVGAKIPLVGSLMGSFSTANTAGGFEGKINRQAEKDRKFTDMLGYDKHQHVEMGDEISKREVEISGQEDVLEAYRSLVQQAKADKQNGGSGTIIYKDPATGHEMMGNQSQLQLDANAAQESLRKMKKGTNEKWQQSDIGAKKLDGTKVTQTDVDDKKLKVVTLNDMGVEAIKKAQENLKTARAKEYLNNRIVNSGKKIVHEEKRDALGNVTRFAHAGMETDWKRLGKNMRNDLISGLAVGGALAVPAAIVAGPWAAVAAAGYGLSKVVRAFHEDSIGGMRHEVAHLASDTSHQIHKATSTYKSPTSGFTDMFKGLGGSGDHGGGGHAAAHDDHGGGHGGGGGHH